MKQIKSNKEILRTATRLLAAAFLALSPLGASAATLDLGRQEAPVTLSPNNPALALEKAFTDVAAVVGPAVVNISAEWTEDVRGFGDFGDMDQFFNYFFYGPNGQRRHPEFKQKQRALGSGFLITSDGYILTNAHVLGKAEKVTVTFGDGSTYPGKIVGKDEKVDIGVVKIEDGKKRFPHVVLGNSDALKVGEWAVAIGNPFALDHTVTAGVISAKGRSVEMGEQGGLQNYIQTDASINPGNSGGPLCNIYGEVIGINSAIYSQSGGSIGIGFAIPSNIARKAAEDLVNEGHVVWAGLGAIVQGLTPAMAKSFGLETTEGALLSSINPGSAAERAGLKPGDIVLSVDGEKVTSSGDLVAKLHNYKPGDTVQMTILRNGSQSPMPVTLQKLDENAGKALETNPMSSNPGTGQNNGLGLVYQDQTPDLQGQLPEGAPKGPVVVQVDPQGPAAAGGLQAGDIILRVNRTIIYSANQLSVVLKKSDLKSGVRLFVWRNGVTLYAFLQTGDQ
jgi:serine protease Do